MAREPKGKDLIPLTVDMPLTTEQDGVNIVAIAAVWEAKHLVAALTYRLRPRGKRHAAPKTRIVRLTDPADVTDFVQGVLPHAKERVVQKVIEGLESGVDPVNLAVLEAKKSHAAREGDGGDYKVEGGCICARGPYGGFVPLCNFNAVIEEDVLRDDGSEETRGELHITGWLKDGRPLPRVRVSYKRFLASTWPLEEWGSRAQVEPGMGTRDKLRLAIQKLSADPPQRTIYAHTGWRQIEGARYYLHAGGAIGAEGARAIDTALDGKLQRAILPEPPTGDGLVTAVRASLALLDLAPETVMAPVLACAYRAPLCEAEPLDTTVYLHGSSGNFKTALTALIMAHFGDYDERHLPASWLSTGNALEKVAFLAKDMCVVVDDFAPAGTPQEIAKYHANAERLLRAVGNLAGRDRMAADGRLRDTFTPRGAVLSSGEDVPKGHSVEARMLIVDVEKGDVDVAKLTQGQATAQRGAFRGAMSGYIRWLAGRFEEVQGTTQERFLEWREEAHQHGVHARMPSTYAHLMLGWDYWLRFAVDCGAVTPAQAQVLLERARAALAELVERTQRQMTSQEPATRFVKLLASVLSTGRAHLLAAEGGMPVHAERWGWRSRTVGEHEVTEPLTRQHIGWVEGEDIYLDPDAAYAAVQQLARDQADGCALGPRTLWKRLREKGLLASWDEARKRNLVRKTVQETRRDVLHLHLSTLGDMSAKTAQSSPSTHSGGPSAHPQRTEQAAVPAQRALFAAAAHENGPRNGPNGREGGGQVSLADADRAPDGPFSWAESGRVDPRNGPIPGLLTGPATCAEAAGGPNGTIGPQISTVTAIEEQAEDVRPCAGGCGSSTLHGWTCKACIEGSGAR